ncbi:MAG: hypothetical protein ACRETP_12105, partial [Steroidobacteraceae bacterium]
HRGGRMSGLPPGLWSSCARCGQRFTVGERVHAGSVVHPTQEWIYCFVVCLACAGRMLDDSAARRTFHEEIQARGKLEFAEPAGRA